jgi:hypothetical protein
MKLRRHLPALGLVGADAIREAFAGGDYRQLEELLRGALRQAFKLAGDEDPWPYVRALFDGSVVVERDGKLWRYPYTVDGTAVTLGAPTEVVLRYVPASEQMREAAVDDAFLEAAGATGSRWLIRVIRAGLSGNRNLYPDAVLREAVPLFAGVRVFVKADAEHLRGEGRDVRNLAGRLAEPRFVEGAAPDQGEIRAVFELLEPEGPVGVKLREAWARGMTGLFGFSIDATGSVRTRQAGGQTIREATRIARVDSVDLIVVPGAGGEVIQLLEAAPADTGNEKDPDMKLRARMLKLIEAKRPDLFATLGTEPDDAAVEAAYREALAADLAPAGATRADVDAAVQLVEARARARETIAASGLPRPAQDRLRTQFDAAARLTEAEVAEAIQAERDYLAQFTESGHVRGLGEGTLRVEPGESRGEKVKKMLDAFFDPADRSMVSFKECYVAITGDRRVTGRLQDCDQALLRESLESATFDDVLGNSITRRMLADYRSPSLYDGWRRIVSVVPIADFRSQERTRFGGYGDMPDVAQGAPYLALSSPTDEKATYSVGKKGGTEDVTLEMIKNDDVGVIQRIPVKLARAAKRTLAKFVFDFIRTNPTIYDGVALFHASHGNLGAAALSAAALAAGRLAMLKQTELNSADRIGIGPRTLLLPPDLEETGVDLFRRNTNNDKNFVQSLTLDIVPVWYWTDANDWALAADPLDIPTIEVGFLDGQEEPELFAQDSPTVGSMFSHDKLTWKLRHIYGGAVTEFRGLYKAVVA